MVLIHRASLVDAVSLSRPGGLPRVASVHRAQGLTARQRTRRYHELGHCSLLYVRSMENCGISAPSLPTLGVFISRGGWKIRLDIIRVWQKHRRKYVVLPSQIRQVVRLMYGKQNAEKSRILPASLVEAFRLGLGAGPCRSEGKESGVFSTLPECVWYADMLGGEQAMDDAPRQTISWTQGHQLSRLHLHSGCSPRAWITTKGVYCKAFIVGSW